MNYPIKKGDKGADVQTIQLALGIAPETQGFGYFGNMTESKLMAKIGKKTIDSEADFNAIVPPLKGNLKAIFNKLKRGEKLSQVEREQINNGIGKIQGLFQTVKGIFGKKDAVLDSASGNSGSMSDIASGAGSGAEKTSEGLSMTAKIGIGVGALALITTIIILATRKGK